MPCPSGRDSRPLLFLISTLAFLPQDSSPTMNKGLAQTGRNINFQALARHLVAMSRAVFPLAELELLVSLVTATRGAHNLKMSFL